MRAAAADLRDRWRFHRHALAHAERLADRTPAHRPRFRRHERSRARRFRRHLTSTAAAAHRHASRPRRAPHRLRRPSHRPHRFRRNRSRPAAALDVESCLLVNLDDLPLPALSGPHLSAERIAAQAPRLAWWSDRSRCAVRMGSKCLAALAPSAGDAAARAGCASPSADLARLVTGPAPALPVNATSRICNQNRRP